MQAFLSILSCDSCFVTSKENQAASTGTPESGTAAAASSLVSGGLSEPKRIAWQIGISDVAIITKGDGEEHKLGTGASGTWYRATIDGVREVAVTQFDAIHDAAERLRIEEHASMYKDCRNRHVVDLLGFFTVGQRFVLVSEYMEGGDLRSAIKEHRDLLSWYNMGRRVALQVALGLHYLHCNNFHNLDLRSHNILLTDNYDARISVAGVFKRLVEEVTDPYWPNCNIGIGEMVDYPPEFLLGKECTQKVDIYSYGKILWELVTTERPRRGCLREPRVPEECPAEVTALMEHCLSIEAQDRPSSRDLVEILIRLQK